MPADTRQQRLTSEARAGGGPRAGLGGGAALSRHLAHSRGSGGLGMTGDTSPCLQAVPP